MPETDYTTEQYIKSLELGALVAEPAIRKAIRALGIPKGRGLDAPCGIGMHSVWFAAEHTGLLMEGVDFAPGHVEYARGLAEQKCLTGRLNYSVGDLNNLRYEDDSFDFIWCCDGLWPGPVEMGCVAEEPYGILDSFRRIVRPGGTIAVLYWSGQILLPGYPFVESALNVCSSACFPMTADSPPELHFMNTAAWLRKTGLVDIRSRTFSADIAGPVGPQIREFLHGFAAMRWSAAEKEVGPDILTIYREITDPGSESYIFNNPDYAGFLTYTMFSGAVPGE